MADQNYFNKFGGASEDQEIGWEGTITDDGGEYVLLAPGIYPFIVRNVERKRYTPKPGSKLPACNQAVVHLVVVDSGRETDVQTNLFLTKAQEWTLSAFFRAIGQKKRGEPLRMNWNTVPGASGYVEIGNREYKGQKYNEVKRFIDPDKAPAGSAAPASPAPQQGKTYTPGSF